MAKTQNFSQLATSLAGLAARLPYGQQLLSQWKDDLNIFDPNTPGSGLAMQQKLLSDTGAFVQNGATDGKLRVIGGGASVFNTGGQRLGSIVANWHPVPIGVSPVGNSYYHYAVATVTTTRGDTVQGQRLRE